MKQPATIIPYQDHGIIYNAALYMRLSRDDGDPVESESIGNQRRILSAFAREQGFNIVGEYTDDGWSGTTFNRPGFRKMIADIEAKKINCVITKDLSRLGRDHIMVGYYTENYFPEHGIRYIAINDRVDTDEGDSDIAPFMNIFNEFHAKQTSKKVRCVFESKFKDGECHYRYPPYGYDKDPDRKNHLVPDPETGWVIEKIFEMAESGSGSWTIRKWLYDNRIITPGYRAYIRWGAYKKTYDDAPEERKYEWGLATVKRILKDPVYIGCLVHYRKRQVSFKNHKIKNMPKSKQMYLENTHEALVSKDRFDRVQNQIEVRRRKTNAGAPHIFVGIAVCADCGGYMRFGHNRGRDYSYLCCGKKSEIGSLRCTAHNIRYDKLCDAVLKKIQDLYREVRIDKDTVIERLSNELNTDTSSQQLACQKELSRLRARRDELSRIISKLYEDWASQRITGDMFNMMSNRFRDENTSISTRIQELESESEDAQQEVCSPNRLVSIVESMPYPTELTSELVNLLIEKIRIHESIGRKYKRNKSQEIEIYWRFAAPTKPEVLLK